MTSDKGLLWRKWNRLGWLVVLTVVFVFVVFSGYLALRFLVIDRTPHHASAEEHFKYGSTGGERLAGIPLGLWHAMPKMCRKYLPGEGAWGARYEAFGFLYEEGADLPIGASQRRFAGFDRVFLNCAACHTGSYRETPQSRPEIVLGMPANTIDLQAFQKFVFSCVTDERFNAVDILAYAEEAGADYGLIDRVALKLFGVTITKELLLLLRHRFEYQAPLPAFGPGRYDTFGPAKRLLNWDMESLPAHERIGTVDFPSIWNQGPREGMQLHWDGNNTSVEERNRSAAFGTGAMPVTFDWDSVERMAAWLWDQAKPPAYPFAIDRELAAKGAPIYQRYCADCHGQSGSDFTGGQVGQVVCIDEIGTDRHRLDNYTFDLAVNQNLLYAGFPEKRFRHFRKTCGYANSPLDGLWLRAPYLHNGSVPNLRALLAPAAERPRGFYRGDTLYDQANLGFVADRPAENGRPFFRYDTTVPGNGNGGHEGPAYGTDLPEADKDALLEYLKTF